MKHAVEIVVLRQIHARRKEVNASGTVYRQILCSAVPFAMETTVNARFHFNHALNPNHARPKEVNASGIV